MPVGWGVVPGVCEALLGLIAGYVVSLGIGWFVVGRLHAHYEQKIGARDYEPEPEKRIASGVTGTLERMIFTTAVIYRPELSIAAMLVWLGLKMAANWNKDVPPPPWADPWVAKSIRNRMAFLGLLSGLHSMGWAWAGGMLARAVAANAVYYGWLSSSLSCITSIMFP